LAATRSGRGKHARQAAPAPPSSSESTAREVDGLVWGVRWQRALALFGVLCAGALAYSNSFRGVFLLDDGFHINDATLGGATPAWSDCLSNVRGMVQCSLSFDYARTGLEPAGYHATNLVIHLCAALALYGVVRRGVALGAPPTLRALQVQVALATTLLWVVHPLTTQAVTYVIQRAESLMSLFYLLTVYASLRRFGGGRAWSLVAVGSCLLGVCTKPVIVTAPLLVFILDRTFVSGGIGAALKRRPLLYAGFAGALLWLYLLLDHGRALVAAEGNAGFGAAGITPARYFLTQGGVLLHYLRLSLVPHPLCFDYGWPPAEGLAAIGPTALLLASVAATAWALWRFRAAGFLAAAFLLLLAPTSSVMPIADLAAEHRMYLALAIVLLGLVLWAAGWSLRRGPRFGKALALLCLVLAVAFAIRTHARNRDYHDAAGMYARIVELRPDNVRAHYNLAGNLRRRGAIDEAIAHYQRALALQPDYVEASYNLGLVYIDQGRLVEARATFGAGLQRQPNNDLLHVGLADALARDRDPNAAYDHLSRALELNPKNAAAHLNLAWLLSADPGHFDEAWSHFRRVLELQPRNPAPHIGLGMLHMDRKQVEPAIARFERALELAPDDARARRELERAKAATAAP